MKKLTQYLILLSPIIAFSSNPPPPGLPDETIAFPIDSMIFVLFASAILFGGYIIFQRRR